jgi:hypothetical protein
VKGRLERARELLRRRLAGRGFPLAVLLMAAAVSRPAAAAGLASSFAPAALVSATINTAMAWVSGTGSTVGVVSPKVAALMEGVLKTMFLTKLKTATAVLLVLSVIGFAGGLLTYHTAAAQQAPVEKSAAESQKGAAGAPRRAAVLAEVREEAVDREVAWGKPLNGLRLGLCRTAARADGKVRLMAVLENVTNDDLIVNLGLMLGNGKKQLPTAVKLTFTDADGKKRVLQRMVGRIAGRVDPFGVPLAAGARYGISCDLLVEQYHDETAVGARLAPVRYRVTAEFVGEAPANTTGLALMTYWTGTIQSADVQVTLPAKPAP